MKILLISTPFEIKHRGEDGPYNHYPMGLAYLHSYVEKNGHKVKTLFLNNTTEENANDAIKCALESYDPEIVGIQIMSHNRVSSYAAIEYVNSNFPNKLIVLGGIHLSVMYEQILKKYPFCFAVIGEGEETFLDIINQYPNINPDLPGIAFIPKGGSKVQTNERRELIENLDLLPFPKHEIFLNKGKKIANLLTSRGCPFNCSFCVLEHFSRRKVRYRSAENVVDEIGYILKLNNKLDEIWIHDDAFFLNNKKAIEICKEIKKRNIKTNFTCSARFKPISDELLMELESAGFRHILFGLESGSEEMLEKIHKKITKEDVISAYKMLANHNIKATAFLITGLPGETDETVDETINFVKQFQKINYSYYDDLGVCMVYPGTEVYKIAKERGMMTDDYWMTNNPVPFYTAEKDEQTLLGWREKIRDNISLGRIFTLSGYKKQKNLIPSAVKYCIKFSFPTLRNLIIEAIKQGNIQDDFLSKENLSKISFLVQQYIFDIATKK